MDIVVTGHICLGGCLPALPSPADPCSLLTPRFFSYVQGGSGMEGLLANMRDLVWIPITQVRAGGG